MSQARGLGVRMRSALARRKLSRDTQKFFGFSLSDDHERPRQENLATKRIKVICVGLLPPPIDGQRIITHRMFDQLATVATVCRLDLDRFTSLGLFSKPLSTLTVCWQLAAGRMTGFSRLYLAPHSGAGLLYSCAIVLVSRILSYRLFVHYHSYKNMAVHSHLMQAFLALCGANATHIVLAPPMARDLQLLYRNAKQICVLSNSVFISQHAVQREFEGRPVRVGHLSNLSRGKGVVTVIECMRRLKALGPQIELVLAGPAEDDETKALLAEAQRELGSKLTYLGRLTGEQVKEFYQSIDIFLFPSLYEHEAEPLVLLESVSFGVAVIATNRGCIPYLLGRSGGRVVDADVFVDEAVIQIAGWIRDRAELSRASQCARERFVELRRQTRPQLERLILSIAADFQAEMPP